MKGTVHWFVLAGPLSPYTLDLWEAVMARSDHRVTLAYVPVNSQAGGEHEEGSIRSHRVELVPVRSPGSAIQLVRRCMGSPESIVVCMGYSPLYNWVVSACLRLARFDAGRLLYMSDTNGVALINRLSSSRRQRLALLAKQAALSFVFPRSFDLGFANALAHRLQGIPTGIQIPLLVADFPPDMGTELPPNLATTVENLPSPRLLVVARLVECKNLTALANAFADATEEGMPGSLTIVGEGPERAAVEPLLRRAPGRIVLAGAVPFHESRRLFGAFDGFVIASTREAWSIAIVEALGWGLPVLSSLECGAGVSMALELGDAVRLCGTSREELRIALKDFVQSLGRHSAAAKNSASWVRDKYGLTRVARAIVAVGDQSLSVGRTL